MKVKLDFFDAAVLALEAMGLDEDDFPEEDMIEQALLERVGVDLETFAKVAELLIPLTIPGQTAILNERYHGFVKDGAFIVKFPAFEATI